MKNKVASFILVASIAFLSACSGNHSDHNNPDTANTQIDPPKSVDTTAPTTTTGDASQLDNSGSGGQKIVRDSTRYPDTVKKGNN